MDTDPFNIVEPQACLVKFMCSAIAANYTRGTWWQKGCIKYTVFSQISCSYFVKDVSFGDTCKMELSLTQNRPTLKESLSQKDEVTKQLLVLFER